MSLAVENPIINSPFEKPTHYWDYKEGQPVLAEGLRPAGYYLRARTRGPQLSMFEEEFVPLETVNLIRDRVRVWRERSYPGITPISRQLLNHWNNPERERKLFFCQREAVEAIIWLVESSPAEKQGIAIPKDNGLHRHACKMATGSGKTVVMGMVIAWQILNKMANPQDRRFSDAVLLLCPNLTIRERLQVLLPRTKSNYYNKFDLVPRSLAEKLHQGKYLITNWHLFQPQDDSRSRSVVQRGPESDTAFCRRVLKELGNKQNLTASEPTEVMAKPAAGYRIGRPDRLGPGPETLHDRNPFHHEKRLQATIYEIAAELTHRLKDKREDWNARHLLFPQVLNVVWKYLKERVLVAEDIPLEEIALLKYKQRIVERLTEAIEPDIESGEVPIMPVIERFRPMGSTSEVLFRTVRPAIGTAKSQISHVVLDAPKWEHSVASQLERMAEVLSYARNDHLDFTIPYEWQGGRHEYRPDYLFRFRCDGGPMITLILEVKGFETGQDRQKETAAHRWVGAVNHHGEFGRWAFKICKDPRNLKESLMGVTVE